MGKLENIEDLEYNIYRALLERRLCHHGFSIQHTLEDIDGVLNRIDDAVKEMEKIY